MVASGAGELISLGAVLPFLAALSDSKRLWQQPIIQIFVSKVGITSVDQLLVLFTLVFAAAAIVAALIRLINLWLNGRLAASIGSDLSCEAYRRTLYQPYSVHVQRNTSAIITGATTHTGRTVIALNAFLQLITSCAVSALLLVGMICVNKETALLCMLFLSCLWSLSLTARRELGINSIKIADASGFKSKLQEGLGSIRDVLLDGSQLTYSRIYRLSIAPNRKPKMYSSHFSPVCAGGLGHGYNCFLGGFLVLQRK